MLGDLVGNGQGAFPFISGYAADIIQKKGVFEEGMEFITKPFKKNDLLQEVREVLDKE